MLALPRPFPEIAKLATTAAAGGDLLRYTVKEAPPSRVGPASPVTLHLAARILKGNSSHQQARFVPYDGRARDSEPY